MIRTYRLLGIDSDPLPDKPGLQLRKPSLEPVISWRIPHTVI